MVMFLVLLGFAWFSFSVGFALFIGPWLDEKYDDG